MLMMDMHYLRMLIRLQYTIYAPGLTNHTFVCDHRALRHDPVLSLVQLTCWMGTGLCIS